MHLRGLTFTALTATTIFVLVAACSTNRHASPAPPAPVMASPAPPEGTPLPLVRPPIRTTNAFMSTPSVYVPDITHSGEPLKDGILGWDALLKTLDVTAGQPKAHFAFTFTNLTSGNVTILNVRPSCGCTTAELPPTPWTVPAGATGEIRLNVQIHGTGGTIFKTVTVTTDQGIKVLTLRINIQPAPPIQMTDDELQSGILAARVDRQAVFRGQCADCHNKNLDGKYDRDLFAAACAICHEAVHRATMVPDLRQLKVPTNEEFWRTWITSGKPGSLMPAFSQSQGGPLNDMQIASLARYLNIINPTKVPLPPAGN